ncbi:MAG: esterase-like activity of phytase family protein [Rhizobiales bacterium]|nr:esterase-like activity of phytase family protein [Hyphomicrobiales bacterium]
MARISRRQVLAGLIAGAAAPSFSPAFAQTAPPPQTFAWRNVNVRADVFTGFQISDPTKREFGPLSFMNGLELRGDVPEFGGLSSAIIGPDGAGFIAITDHAHWVTGRLVADAIGYLTGMENVRISAMQAPNGRRMKDTRFFDSEGLTRIGNRLYVSVERIHQIVRFELGPNGPGGRGVVMQSPEGFRGQKSNQGIEALGVMPASSRHAGSFIAIAERAPPNAESDAIPGWLFGGAQPGRFSVRRKNDFDVTDLGFLPGGDLVILERHYSLLWGAAFRLRRVPLQSIAPGATLDGETLIEANMAYHVDNMEALMIHHAADGRVIFTLMSDNNFSVLQRNLVLRFAYRE